MATEITSTSTPATASQSTLRRLTWAGPLALFAATAANLGLYSAAGSIFPEVTAWPGAGPGQIIGANAVYLLLGTIVFALIAWKSPRPARHYLLVATIIGLGATAVHLYDIAATGNLAPGNTLQNVSNLLDPILLISLAWFAAHTTDPDAESPAFLRWQMRQQPIAGLAAAGVGMGFGIGFAVGGLLLWTLLGTAAGLGLGIMISRRIPVEQLAEDVQTTGDTS